MRLSITYSLKDGSLWLQTPHFVEKSRKQAFLCCEEIKDNDEIVVKKIPVQ